MKLSAHTLMSLISLELIRLGHFCPNYPGGPVLVLLFTFSFYKPHCSPIYISLAGQAEWQAGRLAGCLAAGKQQAGSRQAEARVGRMSSTLSRKWLWRSLLFDL